MEEKIYKGKEEIGTFYELKELLEEWYNVFDCNIFFATLKFLTDEHFQSISQYKYIVNWYFSCSNTQITSLNWFPEEIWWNLSCMNNKLTSLIGCPQKIWWSFSCSSNKLISLEWWPKEVWSTFDCSKNQLISLIWSPISVWWRFDCSNNKLISLEGISESIDWKISPRCNSFETIIPLDKPNFYKIWNNIYYGKLSDDIDMNSLMNLQMDQIKSDNTRMEYYKSAKSFFNSVKKVADNWVIPDIIELNWKKFNRKLLKL